MVPKVSGWLLGLVLYKPFAALAYATAFFLIGDSEGDPRTVFVGLTMLVLSIVALPTMIKFFSWAAPAAVGSSGGGTLAALGGAALTASALRGHGGGDAASRHAAQLSSDLGSPASSARSWAPAPAHTAAPTSAPAAGASGAPAAGAAATTGAGASGAAASGGAVAAGPAGAAAAATLLAAKQVATVAKAAKDGAAGGMTGGGAQ